jgi:hypothetical protein
MNPFFRPDGGTHTLSATSYAGNFGTLPVVAMPGYFANCAVPTRVFAQVDGVFNDLQPIRQRDISDGLAHTMFVTERSMGVFAKEEGPRPSEGLYHGWWFSGNLADTLFVATEPPNAFQRGSRGAWSRGGAGSEHEGGVHALLGDGSVRWISDAIDSWPAENGRPIGAVQQSDTSWTNLPPRGIWQNLATRAGNDQAEF